MTEFDFWSVAIGLLCNVSCALIGCYLVLRRMSLLGDAISHAVLPGLVAAFFLSGGSRASLPMFLGAMAAGVLTAFLTQAVNRFARVPEDSSMGVVFTSLFALGVLLMKILSSPQVDLDPSCVFLGSLELSVLDTVGFWGIEAPRAALSLGAVLIANLAFILLLWKELKLTAFDSALATSLGFGAGLIFYLLMAMVAATTVASFWAVGSILVVAMLIVPASTAHLLTERLGPMMLVAAAVGALSALAGYWLADRLNNNTAGMMAVAAGAQYFLAAAFAPRHGIAIRWARNLALGLRIRCEDILAALFRWEEGRGERPMPLAEIRRSAAGGSQRLALWLLERRGQARRLGDGIRLTAPGRTAAAGLVRSHRLWESYLSRHLGLPGDHLHEAAERMEHFVTPELARALERGLPGAATDPHGRPIPGPPPPAPGSGAVDDPPASRQGKPPAGEVDQN